jgi:Rieske Fe-S protein
MKSLNRREFLILAGLAVADRSTLAKENPSSASAKRAIDAGPASKYTADGVYSEFRSQGFFVIRQGQKLEALSAICTHRGCKVMARPDSSFHCRCHGSNFDPNGRVTHGPAKRDLPMLSSAVNKKGHLIVSVP